MWDGQYNTQLYPNSPARTYVESLGPDWYIPAIDELTYMWQNRFHLNQGLNDHGAGATQLTVDATYFSSTEKASATNLAYDFNFKTGNTENTYSKANAGFRVRAIRALIPLATVTTDTPVPINSTSCTTGGNVISDGGSPVTDRGVCWNAIGAPSLLNSSTHDGTGTGAFTSTITGLTLGQVYYIRAFATNSEGTRYGDEETYTSLSVGDTYQGGIVAYIYQPSDPLYVAGEVHGIISAPADAGQAQWGCQGSFIAGADNSAMHGGLQNSVDIDLGCGTALIAVKRALAYSNGGYTDLYLPSKDDLDKLYLARALIGGFQNGVYWSSTEASAANAWSQSFVTGAQANNITKGTPWYIRAVRYF